MGRTSVADIACAKLDAKISELMKEIDGLIRAKQIIVGDVDGEAIDAPTDPKPRKPRGPNKRRAGLPATETTGE